MNKDLTIGLALLAVAILTYIGCDTKDIAQPERTAVERAATAFTANPYNWNCVGLSFTREPDVDYHITIDAGGIVIRDTIVSGAWVREQYLVMDGLMPAVEYTATLDAAQSVTFKTPIPQLALHLNTQPDNTLRAWVCPAWPGWPVEAAWIEARQLPRGEWFKVVDIPVTHPRCVQDAPFLYKPTLPRGKYSLRIAGIPAGFPVQYLPAQDEKPYLMGR